jgi:hypothetical protein
MTQQQRPQLDRSFVSLEEERYHQVVGEEELFLYQHTENDENDDDSVSILIPYHYNNSDDDYDSSSSEKEEEDADGLHPRILFADNHNTKRNETTSFWAKLCRETSCARKTKKRARNNITTRLWQYGCSLCVLLFSVVLVMSAIFTKQTKTSQTSFPWMSCTAIWILLGWLAMMEGGQGCLVGLAPIEKTMYQYSHPLTYQCTTMVQTSDNMNRFIVGRQFLVTMVVFLINLCGSPVHGISLTGITDSIVVLFLESGMATILMTVMIGQLTAQVNAANCMLDFVNTRFMIFTTWVSLAIETSGLLHAVYLIKYCIFAYFLGNTPPTNKDSSSSSSESRDTIQNILFWLRVGFSTVLLGYSSVVTIVAIWNDQTTMYEGVSSTASISILLVLMCLVGFMEGLQIALFAVVKLPQNVVLQHPRAATSCELAFDGSNFQAFLIGRQICVTICTFIVARITTICVHVPNHTTGEDETLTTLWGASIPQVQEFLNTGLPGALVTTILASLVWRIMASTFPMAFMSLPITYWTIHVCLVVESTGLCSAAWLLAKVQHYVWGYKHDEIYLGGTTVATTSTATTPMDKRENSMISGETDSIATSSSATSTRSLEFCTTTTDYGALPLSPPSVVEHQTTTVVQERYTV